MGRIGRAFPEVCSHPDVLAAAAEAAAEAAASAWPARVPEASVLPRELAANPAGLGTTESDSESSSDIGISTKPYPDVAKEGSEHQAPSLSSLQRETSAHQADVSSPGAGKPPAQSAEMSLESSSVSGVVTHGNQWQQSSNQRPHGETRSSNIRFASVIHVPEPNSSFLNAAEVSRADVRSVPVGSGSQMSSTSPGSVIEGTCAGGQSNKEYFPFRIGAASGDDPLSAQTHANNSCTPLDLLQSGEAFLAKKEYAEALTKFDEAFQTNPQGICAAFVLRRRATIKMVLRRHAAALADFDVALKFEPRSAVALRGRGEAKRVLGRCAEALEDLDEALRLEPSTAAGAATHRWRGQAYLQLGRAVEALADFEAALAIDPQSALARTGRATAQLVLGCPAEALADFSIALRLDPGSAAALRGRGEAKFQLGHPEEALDDLNRALRSEPRCTEALTRRGAVKLTMRQHDDALLDFNEALKLSPGCAASLQGRGQAKLALYMFDNALRDFDSALRIDPASAATRQWRGMAYMQLDKPSEALADFKEALRLNPGLVPAKRGCEAARRSLKLPVTGDPRTSSQSASRADVSASTAAALRSLRPLSEERPC